MPNAALARYMGTVLFELQFSFIPVSSRSLIGVFDVNALQSTPGRIGVGQFLDSAVVP